MTRFISKYPVTQRCGQELRPHFLQVLLLNLLVSLWGQGAGLVTELQVEAQVLLQFPCTCHLCRGPALTTLSKELPSCSGTPGPSHLVPQQVLLLSLSWCAVSPTKT